MTSSEVILREGGLPPTFPPHPPFPDAPCSQLQSQFGEKKGETYKKIKGERVSGGEGWNWLYGGGGGRGG